MAKWIIVKKSRDSDLPYRGITCDMAGIEPGQYYSNKKEAVADAEKLSSFNPVGFKVKIYGKQPRRDRRCTLTKEQIILLRSGYKRLTYKQIAAMPEAGGVSQQRIREIEYS
jgi:hypothetical protein